MRFASAVKNLPNPIHFIKFNQWHDTDFGLDFCAIPKTGSTITGGILCDVLRDYKAIPYRQHFSKTIIGEK
ncbi:unnamed protein product, partial [Mesorhabditis belari]|uniref:Uncharacterized protein n=1 Tax=Mesorhabditis belari TaxID=2138241 RepID=A0AAF3ET01_9BILA